jgi:hypothetical protein
MEISMAALPILPIKVEAYAGYKAEERPVAFTADDKKYKIEEITERAVEEREGRRFVSFLVQVRTDSGGDTVRIYYCEDEDKWYMEAKIEG